MQTVADSQSFGEVKKQHKKETDTDKRQETLTTFRTSNSDKDKSGSQDSKEEKGDIEEGGDIGGGNMSKEDSGWKDSTDGSEDQRERKRAWKTTAMEAREEAQRLKKENEALKEKFQRDLEEAIARSKKEMEDTTKKDPDVIITGVKRNLRDALTKASIPSSAVKATATRTRMRRRDESSGSDDSDNGSGTGDGSDSSGEEDKKRRKRRRDKGKRIERIVRLDNSGIPRYTTELAKTRSFIHWYNQEFFPIITTIKPGPLTLISNALSWPTVIGAWLSAVSKYISLTMRK